MVQTVDRPATPTPGVVEPGVLYTLTEFERRLGMTKSAMRSARRAGLRIRRIGKRAFVLGADAIAFVEMCG